MHASVSAASNVKCPPITLSLAHTVALEQLYIDSRHTVVPDAFMNSVSAHGGLVHVFLSVASVSFVGMCTLIENSSKLMTFQSILEFNCIGNVEFSQMKKTLKQKFYGKKN